MNAFYLCLTQQGSGGKEYRKLTSTNREGALLEAQGVLRGYRSCQVEDGDTNLLSATRFLEVVTDTDMMPYLTEYTGALLREKSSGIRQQKELQLTGLRERLGGPLPEPERSLVRAQALQLEREISTL